MVLYSLGSYNCPSISYWSDEEKCKANFGLLAILAGEWNSNLGMGLHNPHEIPSLLIGIVCNQIVFWISELAFSKPIKQSLLQPIQE
ncbi:MAG: hypothetical protein IPM91_02400 [Bacteroidetes bacterium]|nr:hypothetical protein [Bacteroidota bacterium]